MKHNLPTLIVAVSALTLIPLLIQAEDSPRPRPDGADYSRNEVTRARRANRLNEATKASDLLGMSVVNYQEEKLGKVEDLSLDVESGRIVQVILSTGGFVGIGDTLTAVPPGALHHDVARKELHLNATKDQLKNASPFDMSKWAEHSDVDHLSAVYRHYGEESYFKFIHRGDDRLEGRLGKEAQNSPDRAVDADAPRSADSVARRAGDTTWDKNRADDATRSMIPVSRLDHLQKASKLIGTSVKNLQDESVGKVDNVLVDLPSGRIVALVVSSGGFLGIGDELSAIPPTALRFSSDWKNLHLDTSKEMLSAAPHFQANQWPDFAQPAYADSVYRSYKVQPYFTTNTTVEPDNTALNVRDRQDRTVTPLDQGNSRTDLDTTARIRKGIMARKELSLNAKNVKIITNKGQITLRGPVNTEDEKRQIGEIAAHVASTETVNNELDVKSTPPSNK